MVKQYAMFPGRYRPFHEGHRWLINQKLKQGFPVWIAVRDTITDEDAPYSTKNVINHIKDWYMGKDVIVTAIPDIESINYGREVDYEINEYVPPEEIYNSIIAKIQERASRKS